jgi:hypothetical protein
MICEGNTLIVYSVIVWSCMSFETRYCKAIEGVLIQDIHKAKIAGTSSLFRDQLFKYDADVSI